MRKKKIFELESLYRENLVIEGYEFGEGDLGACIIGSLRGNEIQQMYVCSRLIHKLKELEKENPECIRKRVLVVPSANHYSLNIGQRFWAPDHTDINRMFPGYNEGETVQRIADGIFQGIKDYPYGLQFTSNYVAGDYTPHIRIMRTGLEDIEDAKLFGMPYVVIREPRPYDTTTLNYNWQIWDTDAFSIYTGVTDRVDNERARMSYHAVLRFLYAKQIVDCPVSEKAESIVINEDQLATVQTKRAGLFHAVKTTGDTVQAGDTLAYIYDSFEGDVLEEIKADVSGIIFFNYTKPLVYAKTIAYKILAE